MPFSLSSLSAPGLYLLVYYMNSCLPSGKGFARQRTGLVLDCISLSTARADRHRHCPEQTLPPGRAEGAEGAGPLREVSRAHASAPARQQAQRRAATAAPRPRRTLLGAGRPRKGRGRLGPGPPRRATRARGGRAQSAGSGTRGRQPCRPRTSSPMAAAARGAARAGPAAATAAARPRWVGAHRGPRTKAGRSAGEAG